MEQMSTMEWIETTGKTVAEAREHALDQLRVDESEIEFEVIEEPRSGLFGRTRGVARVRARVSHKVPRPKAERRRRTKKPSGNGAGQRGRDAATPASKEADRTPSAGAPKDKNGRSKKATAERDRTAGDEKKQGEEVAATRGADASAEKAGNGAPKSKEKREPMAESDQIEAVENFLSGLLESFGIEAELESKVDGKDLVTNVSGEGLGLLVGPRMATLEAIQELTRLSLQRDADGKEYARVTVDVAGIREARRASLEKFVRSAAEQARDEGKKVVFEEMSSADRKQVHDLAATIEGVKSVSEGEDPRRRVALVPDR